MVAECKSPPLHSMAEHAQQELPSPMVQYREE